MMEICNGTLFYLRRCYGRGEQTVAITFCMHDALSSQGIFSFNQVVGSSIVNIVEPKNKKINTNEKIKKFHQSRLILFIFQFFQKKKLHSRTFKKGVTPNIYVQVHQPLFSCLTLFLLLKLYIPVCLLVVTPKRSMDGFRRFVLHVGNDQGSRNQDKLYAGSTFLWKYFKPSSG